MSILPKAVSKVIESFERLPGIGPKTAQRLAFYLLHIPQEELDAFVNHVSHLKTDTVLCSLCKNVSESDPCTICSDTNRDHSIICVVEQPTDILSIEKTGSYKGLYHVLHGILDPLNNIGPDEIYLEDLIKRVTSHTSRIAEIILALNPNMEGEATSLYMQKQLSHHQPSTIHHSPIIISRLAHGLPVGADIEYADEVTLKRAMEGRRQY